MLKTMTSALPVREIRTPTAADVSTTSDKNAMRPKNRLFGGGIGRLATSGKWIKNHENRGGKQCGCDLAEDQLPNANAPEHLTRIERQGVR
jgi:hypothetical protein